MIEAALVPGGIVRRPLHHPAAGRHGHRVGVDSLRAVDRLDDVLRWQMPEGLRPVHRRQLRRQIERLRRADQILLWRITRKHRPHLVLLAIDPRDEEHLHGSAAIPVALLEIRCDPANAGAEALHVHRGVCGMPQRRNAHLILGRRRTARRPDLAVRPRLLRQPLESVVAVGGRSENVVVALGEEVAALVLDDVGVAALDGRQRRTQVCRHAIADVPVVEVVRGAHPDGRHFRRRILRPVDVGREPHAVAHRHHHLALDDGKRLEFLLRLPAPGCLIRREPRATLREPNRHRSKECDQRRRDKNPS